MEPEGSLPPLQMPSTSPCPDPARPSPCFHISFQTHLNIFLPSTPGSPKWSLSLTFPHQNHVYASPSHLLHVPLIEFFSIWSPEKKFGEEYRSLSSSLCSFLHSSITSSLFGPNILLNTFRLLQGEVNSVKNTTTKIWLNDGFISNRKLHVPAYSGHHQVLTSFLLWELYIICISTSPRGLCILYITLIARKLSKPDNGRIDRNM